MHTLEASMEVSVGIEWLVMSLLVTAAECLLVQNADDSWVQLGFEEHMDLSL